MLNAIVFQGSGPGGTTNVDQFLQVLYLVIGTATALLVASRRAARDGLVDALADVSALAEEIEARDARLELMLAASGTGFWEWDVETGELTWSEAIFRQHGLEPADHAPEFGAYLRDHPPRRPGGLRERDRRRRSRAAGTFDLEFRVVWPDGSVHWTHGAGRVFRDETGRPLRMVGTGQDITERRRLDRGSRPTARPRSVAPGEFREAFVDVISHELRTPITTILGLTQILARPGRTDDDASRRPCWRTSARSPSDCTASSRTCSS